MFDSSFGNVIQNGVLARDPLELGDILLLNVVLRTHLDLVHDLDEQIDQPIGNLLGAEYTEGSQQREAFGGGVGKQARRFFYAGAVAIDGQHLVGNAREQVGGELQFTNASELGHLLQHGRQANPSRVHA